MTAKKLLILFLSLCLVCVSTGAIPADDGAMEGFDEDEVFDVEPIDDYSMDGVVTEGEGVEEVEIITIEDDESPLMRFFNGMADSLNGMLFQTKSNNAGGKNKDKNKDKGSDAGAGAIKVSATKSGNNITISVGGETATFKNAFKKNSTGTYTVGDYEVRVTYNGGGIKSVAVINGPPSSSEPSSSEPSSSEPSSSEPSSSEPSSSEPSSSEPSSSEPSSSEPSSSEPSSSEPSSSEPSSSEPSSSEPSSSEPSSSEPSSSEPSSSEPSSSEPSSSEPSSSEPSSSEPEPVDPDATFVTVAELRGGSGYAEGDTVTTAGFYTAGDGGGASYTVGTKAVNEPLVIAMSNGLTAELVIEEEMSVLQFGAVNDGETDSKLAFQTALDSDAAVLTFPRDGNLMIRGDIGARTNKRLDGNNCTLLTDNNYSGKNEFFVSIVRTTDFQWDSLNILAAQTKTLSFRTQIGVQYASNVSILNSDFTGPEAVYKADGTAEFAIFHNIDVWSGWGNVTIDSCSLTLTHDGPEGCNVMARDIQDTGVLSGFTFTNNKLYKICHDEMLNIGSWNDNITDVVVRGNEFYARDGKLSGSDFLFSFLSNEGGLSDVVVEDNTFDVQSTWLFQMISIADDISIRNNDISFMTNSASSARVFYQDSPSTEPIEITDNSITIDNTGEFKVGNIFHGNIDARNNTVVVDGDLVNVFAKLYNGENNTVEVRGDVSLVSSECMRLSDNTVSVDGTVGTVFRYNGTKFADTAVLSGNIITTGVANSDKSFAVMATNITLNGNRIELYGNVIDFPAKDGGSADFRYNINTLDNGEPVKIYMEDLESYEDYEAALSGTAGAIAPVWVPSGALTIPLSAAIPGADESSEEEQEASPTDLPSSEAPPPSESAPLPSESEPVPPPSEAAPLPLEPVPPPEEPAPFDIGDIDIGEEQNMVYFAPDNYLSDSLTNTYLRGGVTVLSPRDFSTDILDDDPALSDAPGFFTGTMLLIATILLLLAIAGILARIYLKRRASKA